MHQDYFDASAAQRFDEHVLKIKRGFQAATRNTKFPTEAALLPEAVSIPNVFDLKDCDH
jgi:hypothetical protein